MQFVCRDTSAPGRSYIHPVIQLANKHFISWKGLSASCNLYINLCPLLALEPDHPMDQGETIFSSVASLQFWLFLNAVFQEGEVYFGFLVVWIKYTIRDGEVLLVKESVLNDQYVPDLLHERNLICQCLFIQLCVCS